MPNSKSGRGSFRYFYFSYFTFHFYMYKGLRGIRKKVYNNSPLGVLYEQH